MTLLAIIRVRGSVKVKHEILDTLNMLNLTRANHCSLFLSKKETNGMIKKVQDYVTYGEISKEVLLKLFKKRARLSGDKKIDDAWLKEHKLTWDKLIDLFEKDQKEVYKLGVKKVFRLSPPSKGFERKGIKMPYTVGGVLGDRKDKINDLLLKMI